MALKPCKECGKEISTEAKACPNCGKKNPTSTGTPRLVWAVVVVGILVAIGLASSNSSSPPAAPLTAAETAQRAKARAAAQAATHVRDSLDTQIYSATQLCHNAALKLLKSPATAKFQDDETYTKDLGKGRTHVQLQVDAENGFSALIRTTIDCKTKQSGGNVSLTSFNSWSR